MSETKKIVLTEEVREKLHGLLPMDSNAKHVFVPSVFKNKELGIPSQFHPQFTIKQLSNEDAREIKTLAVQDYVEATKKGKKKTPVQLVEASENKQEKYISVCSKYVTNWSNLYDLGTGEIVEYKDGGFLELPKVTAESVVEEILKISGLSS
jgi:hypothetical protein